MGVSSSTRGVWGGGNNPTLSNVIDYITIASLGNSQDFGDLTVARRNWVQQDLLRQEVFGWVQITVHQV